MRRARFGWAALLLLPAALAAVDDGGFVRLTPDQIPWSEPDGRGISSVVLAGDPQREGFYMIRAKFPPGIMSAPHYHPNDRHVTVISGTWYTGTGPDFDRDDTVPLGPGSYMMHPGGAVHYDGAKDEEVIVEIKGIGPAPSIAVVR